MNTSHLLGVRFFRMKLYLPSALPVIPVELKDAAEYILHRIYVGRALWTTKKGYTTLHSHILFETVGPYAAARDWLLANHIIITDGYYTKGRKSYGYKWTQPYSQASRVTATDTLAAKMAVDPLAEILRKKRNLPDLCRTYKHLLRNLQKVEFDTTRAKKILANLAAPINSNMTNEEYRDILLSTTRLLVDGQWDEFTVCNYGRVHSPITRLAKVLHCCVIAQNDDRPKECNHQPRRSS